MSHSRQSKRCAPVRPYLSNHSPPENIMPGNNLSDQCILVVDDNDLVRKTLRLFIESFGYSCSCAIDGLDAVDQLKTTSYDLVLSDIKMPRMDGMKLLRYITQHHPTTGVIIATGYSERAGYADVIKAGAIDYITKPIDSGELEAKLVRALRERALLHQLEELSTHDSLTSLYNRRGFENNFHREMERAIRQNYSIFLALIDIDNFKEYNDQYGHQKGDDVLIILAQILLTCTRISSDICCRPGGDEFTIVLPKTSSRQAMDIIKRILDEYVSRQLGTTTLSIGLVSCQYDPHLSFEENKELTLEWADRAMYRAKKSGKNRIVSQI